MTTSHDERPTLLPTDLTARIDFLKSLCDYLTIATVVNDDTPSGYSWEAVGICENDGHPEVTVAGYGFTVAGAIADAIVHVD